MLDIDKLQLYQLGMEYEHMKLSKEVQDVINKAKMVASAVHPTDDLSQELINRLKESLSKLGDTDKEEQK